MRKAALGLTAMLILIILLPFIIIKCSNILPPLSPKVNTETRRILTGESKIKVYIKKSDKVQDMDLEEYIKGVVAAEMPASYPLEALKAQAVAARTYVANRVINGGDAPEHHGAQVCTDFNHCNAWISKDDAFKNWGNNAENNWKKINDAVDGTKGEIITYDNQPISALFFSMSSGKTEDAKDVWGGSIPYLKSVDSPGDKEANGYASHVEFTTDDFKQRIFKLYPDAKLNGEPSKWVGMLVRTQAGGVKEMPVGGINLSGTDVRKAFELRSTNFTLNFKDNKFVFDVLGYGHDVGMSQYGAKYFANKGDDYKTILKIYYTGVSVSKSESE